jgi:very-short-patch-repair endonuclease
VDFYCQAGRLGIEVDGPIHEFQRQEDFKRERILRDNGLQIIHFSNAEIESNLTEVLKRILHKTKSRIP